MKTEFFIEYGCYLEMIAEKVVVEHSKSASLEVIRDWLEEIVWEPAIDSVQGWYGQHGFEIGGEEEDEEEIYQYCVDHTDCFVALWDEEEHGGKVGADAPVDEYEYSK
jgi:hypothetical protein